VGHPISIYQGDWNCDLTSLPIEEDKYDDDQQFFKLKYLKLALVSFTQVQVFFKDNLRTSFRLSLMFCPQEG